MRTKSSALFIVVLACGVFAASISTWALGLAPGSSVYPKRAGAVVYGQKSPTSQAVGKLNWGQAYSVLAVDGRWALLDTGKGKGWIYVGNISQDKPPEVNRNDLISTEASEVSTAAAARGLDIVTSEYAGRHNLSRAVADLEWMEQWNDSISMNDVRAYMLKHKLGEFAAP